MPRKQLLIAALIIGAAVYIFRCDKNPAGFYIDESSIAYNAYTISQKISDEAQDVYWEMLKDIPDDKFAKGVKQCLASCKFFPTIAELGEASMPSVTDYRAPLPPVDKERPMINWRVQLEREKKKQEQIESKQRRLPN